MFSVPASGSSPEGDEHQEPSTPHAVRQPVFVDEKHGVRLYQGDALVMLREARSEMFDLIFADPPYFLSNDGITCQAGKMVSVNKGMWDKAETFEAVYAFNLEWLRECHRLLKPNGSLWVTGTSHNIYSVGFALQTLGYKILNDIAWYKVNPPPNLSCRYFTHATETILWARRGAKARHTFNYEEMKRENRGKQMQSLWHIKPPAPREKRYGKHPTQKPEALLDRLIRASSNPGEMVLDPFCGSATTGVVCARLGRRFVGFEMDQSYIELATKRLEDEIMLMTKQEKFAFGTQTAGGGPNKSWPIPPFTSNITASILRTRPSIISRLRFRIIMTQIFMLGGIKFTKGLSSSVLNYSY
jgi:site-specific DNA-methyltransferase (adenine-specific)